MATTSQIAGQPQPHKEYTVRLNHWQLVHAAETARFDRIAYFRLATGIGAVLIAGLVWRHVLTPWTILAPLAVFIGLVLWHDRVERRRQMAARATLFYQNGLARLEDRWAGTGNPGERFRDPAHVYCEDLDLFGRGSLFELLCGARTSAGEETLAAWLKGEQTARGPWSEVRSPAMNTTTDLGRGTTDHFVEEVRARQEAVAELRGRLDLREDLALLGEDVRRAVHPELLTHWAASPPVPFPSWVRPATIALAVLAVLTLTARIAGWIATWPTAAVVLLEITLSGFLKRRVEAVIYAVEKPAHELETLSLVIERLERESFSSRRLAELRSELETAEARSGHPQAVPASRLIRRLDDLVDHREWSENLLFRIPALLLMWDQRYAMRIEQWRQTHGPSVGRWMAVIGQTEALSSLAGFAYEHPRYPFAEMVAGAEVEQGATARSGEDPAANPESAAEPSPVAPVPSHLAPRPSPLPSSTLAPLFEAQALCHPLMGTGKCVPNDVTLAGPGNGKEPGPRLLIVSGSNMSGKSTLLRACGLNTVLARCGAPVAAARLRLSPLAVGASIRIVDSLLDNRSRFYAEITRLRQILDLTAGPQPVLFLFDEVLGGTNSHDRRIGAEALLRRLLERGAIGLITTHDLSLAEIADPLTRTLAGCGASPPAENVHFEDQLVGGQIRFDYRLRPGVVRRGNALELMRNLGLIE